MFACWKSLGNFLKANKKIILKSELKINIEKRITKYKIL